MSRRPNLSQLPPDEIQKNKISKEQAIRALWRKGVVHWKLDSNQMDMHKLATESSHSIVVIGSSRQIGKSFFLCTLAIETCLRTPNVIVKYIAPKVKDVRRIIAPLIRDITSDAPEDIRPSYRTQEHVFRFPNGSEIQLAGTDNGHAESMRGNRSHLCIIDEAGFCDDLNYIVNSILIPTTTTTGGKIIMASTPPKSPDHDFMLYMRKAEAEGAFIKKTIYDNPRLTQNEINRLADAVGGVDSVDFKREYLVELMTSLDDAVIPEFTKELQAKIIKEWKRPPYYDTYVSMDIGFRDLTVLLFGYYDFRAAKLIIEDELVFQGKQMVTDTLAASIKVKEKELFTNELGDFKEPLIRVSDNNNLILLNDLIIKHNIVFVPSLKDNAEAALNNLRMLLKNERIIINPKCRTLISHLEGAIWNKARNSYARSADKGHYDAVDAAKMLCRVLNTSRNPYPAGFDMNINENFFVKELDKPTTFEKQIQSQFKIRNPRFYKKY